MLADMQLNQLDDFFCFHRIVALTRFRIDRIGKMMQPATNTADVSRWIHFQLPTVEPVVGKADEVRRFAAVIHRVWSTN